MGVRGYGESEASEGIYLTEKVMDNLPYARQGQLNVLTMKMTRHERDGQEAAGGDSDGDY